EYCCAMSRMVVSSRVEEVQKAHGISIETGSFAPVCHKNAGWDSYTFMMGGIIWLYCVTNGAIPEQMKNAYLRENGQFYLMLYSADEFFINFARKAVAAGNLTKEDAEESMRTRIFKNSAGVKDSGSQRGRR
ncbi:MAG: hypothetical protein WCD79_07400, partial [Chthoniobacteraceae bacterium]